MKKLKESFYSTLKNKILFPKRGVLSPATLVAFLLILLIGTPGCSDSDDFEVFSTIEGTITDYQTGLPLQNAVITLSPSGLSRQTDITGVYKFEGIDAQQYTLTVQKSGYQPNRKTIVAISGETITVDIQLTIIPK